jgi:predicted membrane-bound mannosyltransferase
LRERSSGSNGRHAAPDAERVEVEPVQGGTWRDVLEGEQFWKPALAVLIVGIVLRQLWLANFAYHPDEAIHAWYPLDLKDGYKVNPVYHGPVMYYLTAFTYGLFGAIFKWLSIEAPAANDYTGRLAPSLLGIGLLFMVVFGPLRRWQGARAVLWSAALLAISPVIVTYSRRTLHDALVLCLTLGCAILFQSARENRAWTERGFNAWLGLAALVGAFLATKANAFFLIAMLGSFWVATLAQRMVDASPTQRAWREWASSRLSWLPLFLLFTVSLASYIFAVRDENALHRERLFSLTCLWTAAMLWVWIVLAPRSAAFETVEESARTEEEEGAPLETKHKKTRTWRSGVLAAWAAVGVFVWFTGHGYLWWKVPVEALTNRAAWSAQVSTSFNQIKNAATGGPLETQVLEASLDPKFGHRLTAAPDWDSATMALPRMVAYWKGQHQKPRLPGRHDYYITLAALYELPIMLAALGGFWYAARHRTAWGDLLLWWAFTTWALYALANEKVPWLLVHSILPFALLGGWWLSRVWETWAARDREESQNGKAGELIALGALCALGAVFLLRGTWATNFQRAAENREPMFYAQTHETFRDEMERALKASQGDTGMIWMHGDKQWPGAWYFRSKSERLGGSNSGFGPNEPDAGATRLVITTPEDWAERKKKPEYAGWKGVETGHYIWPRASWPALRLDRFLLWWANREATPAEERPKGQPEWKRSILSAPGEWSDSKAVFATPPAIKPQLPPIPSAPLKPAAANKGG